MTVRELDQAAAQAVRSKLHAEAPEILPFIRSLFELGLIEGWRRVLAVNASEKKD